TPPYIAAGIESTSSTLHHLGHSYSAGQFQFIHLGRHLHWCHSISSHAKHPAWRHFSGFRSRLFSPEPLLGKPYIVVSHGTIYACAGCNSNLFVSKSCDWPDENQHICLIGHFSA